MRFAKVMDESNLQGGLTEQSPSVQTHLGILQAVINRMAGNSTATKAWCVTLVSAVLVLVADKGRPEFAYLALIPAVLFGALDAYYLALEKGFRDRYSNFVEKVHSGSLSIDELYTVAPYGNKSSQQFKAIMSFSVWGFYGSLISLVLIARWIVLP